jgi:nucleoside-diphosphate kinase
MSERSLVLLKPDAVSRGLMGQIIDRFERKSLRVSAMAMMQISAEHADAHYVEHVEKSWYPSLREFITGGPLVAMVVEGDQAVAVVRGLIGATDGRKAAPGTIRGDLSLSGSENLVHASDSLESADRELALWFPDEA